MLNTISPSNCRLFLTSDVEPVLLYVLRNVWKNGDAYVVSTNGDVVYSHTEKLSGPYGFAKNIKYDVQVKPVLCAGKSIIYGDEDCSYFEKSAIITLDDADWNSIFEKYSSGIIATLVDGSLLYLSYSDHMPIRIDVLESRNERTFRHTLFDFYLKNIKPIDSECVCLVKNEDSWQQSTSLSCDAPMDLFYKFALQYQPKYTKHVTRNKLNPVFKILHQYMTEKILYHTKSDTGILFFDSYTIDSREFVFLTSFQTLILINDKSSIVNYLEDIQTRGVDCVDLLNPGLDARNVVPNIEVIDNFDVSNMIATLVESTSFIENSIDMVYIQGEFKYLNTISKLTAFKDTLSLIKSRKGHLYVSFINIDGLMIRPKISSIVENLMFIINPVNVSMNCKTPKIKKAESLLLRLTDREYANEEIQTILKYRESVLNVASAVVVKIDFDSVAYDDVFWVACRYDDKVAFLHLPENMFPPYIQTFVKNQFANGKLIWNNNKDLCITAISASLLNMIFGEKTHDTFEPELSQTPYTTSFITQYIGKNLIFDPSAIRAEQYFAAYTFNAY